MVRWIVSTCIASCFIVQSKSKNGVLLPLKGGIATIGEYYAEIGLGTPEQMVKLQVDTGSSSLIVTSKECDTCLREGHQAGGVFNKNESSTAIDVLCSSKRCGTNTCSSFSCRSDICSANNNACCSSLEPHSCGFFLQYGGDTDYHVSAEGVLLLDTLTVGTQQFPNVTIYRSLKEEGPWPTSVDGILGLGYPRLNCNPTCSEPVYDAMLEQLETHNVFALCLGDTSGVLVLGSDGKSEGLYDGKPEWVPVMSTELFGTYYTVGLDGLLVGSATVASLGTAAPRQAIVDSGTTLLLLENELWLGLVRYFKTHFCRLPGVCSSRSIFEPGVCLLAKPKNFPNITLTMSSGLHLILPPSLYFITYEDEDNERSVYCLGIQPAGHERTVIGDTLLRGFAVVFDLDNRRVGFAEPKREVCGKIAADSTMLLFSGPSSSTSAVKAVALAFGTLAAFAGALGQVLLCTRATRGLHPIHNSEETRPAILKRSNFGTFDF